MIRSSFKIIYKKHSLENTNIIYYLNRIMAVSYQMFLIIVLKCPTKNILIKPGNNFYDQRANKKEYLGINQFQY